LAVVVTAVVAGFVAGDFFRLWIGAAFSENNPFGSVTTIFLLLLVGAAVGASQRVTAQVFFAVIRPNLLASTVLAEALCNLGLSVALIRPLGLVGVALGTLIPALVFNAVVVPAMACRLLRIPLVGFIRSTTVRPLAAAAVLLPVGWTISYLIGSQSWTPFFVKAGVLAMVGVGVAAGIGMTAEDRARSVRQALELWSRLARGSRRAAAGAGARPR
jgi:O-antigen/teichoic acid export membrane protein